MMRRVAIALALSMLAACAAVETAPPPEPKKIETIDEYLAHQDYIRAGLLDGSLGELSERDLEEVFRRQDELRVLLGNVESIEALTEEQKIEVLNNQNAINGILTRSFADTPICRRETVVGSHRQRTVCMTARQREALRDNSRESIRYLQNGFLPRIQ